MKKVYSILFVLFVSSCAVTKNQKNLSAKYPKGVEVCLVQLLQGDIWVTGVVDGYVKGGRLRVLVPSPYFNGSGGISFSESFTTPMHLDTSDVVLVSQIQ